MTGGGGFSTFARHVEANGLRLVVGLHETPTTAEALTGRWCEALGVGDVVDYAGPRGGEFQCLAMAHRRDCRTDLAAAADRGELALAEDDSVAFATFADLVVALDLEAPGLARLCAVKLTGPGDETRGVRDFVRAVGATYVRRETKPGTECCASTLGVEGLQATLADVATVFASRQPTAEAVRLWLGMDDVPPEFMMVIDGDVRALEGEEAVACGAIVEALRPTGWTVGLFPQGPGNREESWARQRKALTRRTEVREMSAILRASSKARREAEARSALARLLDVASAGAPDHDGTYVMRMWGREWGPRGRRA